MSWCELLDQFLPPDVPQRESLIEKSARHLESIIEMNEQMNLTRITSSREAVIKHVVDSVLPWRLFVGAQTVLDAGTGPGLPGIPLSLILPETRFLLVESVQKKARFVDSVVQKLKLSNVEVIALRAEDVLSSRHPDVMTARAVAPLNRILGYLSGSVRKGAKALLYKGPDAETEIEEASAEARKQKVSISVIYRYELPDNMGLRSIVGLNKLGSELR